MAYDCRSAAAESNLLQVGVSENLRRHDTDDARPDWWAELQTRREIIRNAGQTTCTG